MSIGALDTDSAALAKRLELQHRLSGFDLNEWIFSRVNPRPNERWLDLGCGRGEQSLLLARIVESVTSIDLSEKSLEALREADPSGRITTIHTDLDKVATFIEGQEFDGVVGSYSLYYANDPVRLFRTIRSVLANNGRLFFCGPAHANNVELRTLSAEATGDRSYLDPTRPSTFMEEEAPTICTSLFGKVERFTFENPVRFTSADDLVDYWTSHNLYREAALPRFRDLAEQHFGQSSEFVNVKRGIGIKAQKG